MPRCTFRNASVSGASLSIGREHAGAFQELWHAERMPLNILILVAQCSATPSTVPATPPCSATPFQTQISVRHLPGMGGVEGATPKFLGVWRDTAATTAKRYKIQEISRDTCSATGGTRNRVQLRFSYAVKCGNHLRVREHSKNASVSRLACWPF